MHSNDQIDKNTELKWKLEISNFMPSVMVDDEISGNSDLLVVVIDDYLQLSKWEGDSYSQDFLLKVRWISYDRYIHGICLNIMNWQELLDRVIRVFSFVLLTKMWEYFEDRIFR